MSNSEVNTGSNDGDPPKLTVNLPSAKDVDAATKHRNAALLPVDVLLLTVKDCEFFACYRKLINPFRCWFDEIGFLYFEDADNGEKVRVALVQCSEGAVTPGGSLITVTKAVPVLRPKAVISVGTCSSLNPTKTKLGDVVVSAKLKELPTGMRNYVSRRFLKVINHTAYGYKAPLQDPEVREITVHRDGEFLSGPEKVCSESRRKELAQCHHQAIATEMEGGGVFTAAFEDQIEWLIVKGIADYADGDESTTERWSPFASVMAASVVEHILSNAEVFGAWPNYCSEGHSIPRVKFPRADSPSQSTTSHSDLSGQQSTCDERKKWTGMNDGKPSGEQSYKKGRKEKTSGPTCDLDRLIRLIISAEGLDDEQKEALYEILTHNGQLYVKHRKISGDVLEQGIDFFEYLTETYKFNLVRVIRSSLEITMYCPTIESLEHLWSDYLSGHLNDIAERLLVTDEIKRLLSLQKNVRLRTTIEEENYLICKKFLMEMSGLAGHTLSSSEETIPNQVEDTRKGNSSFLMEYSPEQLNYFRICYVALNLVPVGLRQIFRNEWNFLYNRTPLGEWKDAPQNGQDFYNKESRKSRTKNARYLATIQNGDTSEWDCSCLFFAILYSDSIGTTLSPAIRTAVDAIRQVRDEIAHISEGKVTNAEFQTYVGRVSTAFTALHLSIKEIRDVKNQKSFPTKEVKMLKNEVLNLRGELDQAKTVLDETKTGLDHTKANLQATKSTPLKIQADLSSAKEENETLTQELSSKLESFCSLTLKAPHEVIRRSSDIERLSNKMQGLYNAAKGEVSTIFFSGNPGCGKSQLARELGSKFFSDNADALTFVATLNAESVETLAESYLSLGENLGLPEYTLTKLETLKQEKPGESIRHLQRSILRKVRQFSKWLIIADNVVDLNSVRHFLPQTGTEEWGHGQVLITTQDSSAVPLNAPHTYHESFSRGMQPADAVELLEKISQLSDSDQTEKVARILDYQPLALAAAAYYVQTVAKNGSPYYNWSMYLEGFTEIQREVTENVLASESLTYPTPTATAVKMAMERAVETDEVLCQAFLFFAVCSSDAVPLDAVVEFVKVRVTDQTEELIKTKLLKSSLVLLSAEEDKQCLHLALHNIVHAVLKQDAISKLKSWDKNQNIADAVKIFKSLLELSRENRALLNQLAIHCKSLIEHMTFNSTLSIKEFVMEAAHFVTVNQVVDWLCSFSEACAILCDFTLAKSIVDLGCSLIDNINDFGEGALLKGKIFNRSGEAFHSIGKYNEAKNFHEKALMIRRKISGEDHPNVATSYSNLGLVYYEMGEYHRAKEFHEKALMIKRRTFGEDHRDVATSYSNLGLVYEKMGEYNRAKEFHEKALMINRKIYDEDHPNVATSYSSLGLVFYEMGDYNRAREFHEKALMIYRKIYDEDHPNVATSNSNLGLVYYNMGDYNRAKEFHEKALMIYRKIYDEDHPNVATSYSNLGLVYYEMGEYNRAKEFHEKALMIYRNSYDEDNPNVATSYSNLGLVYHEMGNYNQAKEFYEKALFIDRKIYDEDHPNVATIYSNLGLVYHEMGEYNRGKEFHEKALKKDFW